MTKTKLHTLAEVGQSVWLDYIDRPLITSGGLANYVARGLRGVTSNPAIFHKAITDSHEYDEQIQELALDGKSAQEIYEALTVEDSRTAADVLRPVFDETHGTAGFVSLEVTPFGTTSGDRYEATRLFPCDRQRHDKYPPQGSLRHLRLIERVLTSMCAMFFLEL